jgi:hypothetical protein
MASGMLAPVLPEYLWLKIMNEAVSKDKNETLILITRFS